MVCLLILVILSLAPSVRRLSQTIRRGRSSGLLHFVRSRQASSLLSKFLAKFVLGLFQHILSFSRQRSTGPVDVKDQHGHGDGKGLPCACRIVLPRLQRSGDLRGVSFVKTSFSRSSASLSLLTFCDISFSSSPFSLFFSRMIMIFGRDRGCGDCRARHRRRKRGSSSVCRCPRGAS